MAIANVIWAGPAHACKTIVEGLAVDAFTPGELLTRGVDGDGADTLETSADAATVFSQLVVADEQFQTSGGGVDVPVTVNDNTMAIVPESGDLVYLRSAAANYTKKGAPVVSAGNGQVTLGTAVSTQNTLGYTEEVINVTAAGTLILVRVK